MPLTQKNTGFPQRLTSHRCRLQGQAYANRYYGELMTEQLGQFKMYISQAVQSITCRMQTNIYELRGKAWDRGGSPAANASRVLSDFLKPRSGCFHAAGRVTKWVKSGPSDTTVPPSCCTCLVKVLRIVACTHVLMSTLTDLKSRQNIIVRT